MGQDIIIKIPQQLQSSYFFKDKTVPLRLDKLASIETVLVSEQFPYELAYYAGYQCEKPWNNDQLAVSQLVTDWPNLEKKLAQAFEERDSNECAKLMKLGIAIFIQALFWTNNLPVALTKIDENVEKLEWKPINVGERLQFILSRPNFHHSFIQLNELMKELKKQFYIKNI